MRAALLRLTAAAALAALGLWVRAGWIPLARHRFDGHERDYLRAFLGEDLPSSTRLYPSLSALYRLLGTLSHDPRALTGLALGLGLLAVALGGIAAGRRLGERAGWITALLLATSPAHAFWSSSAYNVILPQTLLLGACAARGWWAAPLYAAACIFRVELALLAPAVGLVAGWRAAVGALGGLLVLPLLATAPALYSPLEVLPVNLLLPDFLGPLGSPLGLLLIAAALSRRSAPLIAAAAWVHLVGSCFDDYGWRHGLFGGFALSAAVAGAAPSWRHGRSLLIPPALGLSLLGCAEVARWYYAPPATFAATLPELPALERPLPCREILDDPADPRSHWAARRDWPPPPVCWGEEAVHRAWNSRGLMARRLRMHRAYDLSPLGILGTPEGPRLYYSVRR